MPQRITISADDLRALASQTLQRAGLATADADTIAESWVWANLRGIDSHGISRLPRYLELFEKGEAATQPSMTTTQLRAAALLIDADRAPGPIALSHAVDVTVELARSTGVAWATVRGTVHTGAIGYYTSRAAAQGMAAIAIVAGVPNMGYEGARGAAVATSPLAISVPSGDEPDFLLDMATAKIALGKIAQFKARSEPLPAGVAVTADGSPTTDPAEAKVPLPMGEAKGSGLSLAFELLTSALAENPIVAEFHDGTPDGRRHRQNATLIAVDVSAFLPFEMFTDIVGRTLRAITTLPAAREDAVSYPGQRSGLTAAARERDGIPIPAKVWTSISEVADRLGVGLPNVTSIG